MKCSYVAHVPRKIIVPSALQFQLPTPSPTHQKTISCINISLCLSCIHRFTHTLFVTHTHTYTHTHTHTHTHTLTLTHTQIVTHIHRVCNTYTHTRTYIHTYTLKNIHHMDWSVLDWTVCCYGKISSVTPTQTPVKKSSLCFSHSWEFETQENEWFMVRITLCLSFTVNRWQTYYMLVHICI